MIGWAIETLIATTLLMALVMAIRGPVRRAFGSGVAYALWLLPAARLFMPQLPGNSQLSQLVEPIAQQATQGHGFVVGVMNPAVLTPTVASHATTAGVELGTHSWKVALVPPTATDQGPSLTLILLGLWAAGAAAFLLYYVTAHLRFRRRLLRGAVAEQAIGSVRVIESDAAHGPLAFGVWRKYVAFPRDFADRYDADEREFALLHELGHHHRGDLIANWIALAMLAMHWFDPIAWRAYRAFRADQEMANDARVLAGRSAVERHAYACAIVKAAHPVFGSVSATCHLNTIKDLKGRLKMLTIGRRSRARLVTGAAAVGLLTVTGLGLTASGSAAAGTVRAGVEKATGLNFAKLDAKLQTAPAAPPAPPAIESDAVPPAAPEAPVRMKRVKIVKMDKDGKTITSDWVATPDTPMPPDLPNIPEVRSANCHGGDKRQMVIQQNKGDKRVMIICTDRIQKVAEEGAMTAARSKDIERQAYSAALTGLRNARAQIANNPNMSPEARTEALAGIDEGIREVESDMAHPDKD